MAGPIPSGSFHRQELNGEPAHTNPRASIPTSLKTKCLTGQANCPSRDKPIPPFTSCGIQTAISDASLLIGVNQTGGLLRMSPERAPPNIQVCCNPAAYCRNGKQRFSLDAPPCILLGIQPPRLTSRGAVAMASPDPLIRSESLIADYDRVEAARGQRLIQHMLQAQLLQRIITERRAPALISVDDAALIENFRTNASSVWCMESPTRGWPMSRRLALSLQAIYTPR